MLELRGLVPRLASSHPHCIALVAPRRFSCSAQQALPKPLLWKGLQLCRKSCTHSSPHLLQLLRPPAADSSCSHCFQSSSPKALSEACYSPLLSSLINLHLSQMSCALHVGLDTEAASKQEDLGWCSGSICSGDKPSGSCRFSSAVKATKKASTDRCSDSACSSV